MKKFIVMLQFLTRIPINVQMDVDEDDFLDGMMYFPLVGLVIGMCSVGFYAIGYELGGLLFASTLAVIGEVFITGGLHLDGLGDTFDGVYSNRPKEKVLEIMKDSRLGTNAALAIICLLLLKISMIHHLQKPLVYPILLTMPVCSKVCMVYAARFSVYARKSGMGSLFIGKVSNRHVYIAVALGILLCLLNIRAIPFIGLGLGFVLWYVRHISNKIGGMTGDTLGALCELSELVYLFYFLVVLMIESR